MREDRKGMDRNRESRRLKRRHRSTSLRHSLEEDGQMELLETGRLRGNRRSKRDRDLLNRNKRRRGEETSEECVGGGDDYEDGELPRMLPSNATLSSSVIPNHCYRKSLPPPRHLPSTKVSDETIGFSVPRKARSGSVKRSHDSRIYGNGGFGYDLNHRRVSTSPASGNGEGASVKKKTIPNKPKIPFPKLSNPSSFVEDGIEIEVAEVLFGLMKQSQGSKEEEKSENCMEKPDNDTNQDSNPISTQTSILAQNSDPDSASKKQKVEADNAPIQSSSFASSVKDDSEQPKKMEEFGVAIEEKSVSTKDECITKLQVTSQDSILTEATSDVSNVEHLGDEKFKIDLMAPPPMASSPERDDFINLCTDSKRKSEDVDVKRENDVRNEEHTERLAKNEEVAVELENNKGKSSGEHLELKLNSDKLLQKHQMKATMPKVEMTASTSSLPLPIAPPGGPNGLPPLGYMPPFQTVIAMDGTTGSSAALEPPRFLPSHPRPKRCAMHHYIASNIYLHNQFTKANPFWPAPAGSVALCGTKPNNSNYMPFSEKIIGNPLQGVFPVVNTNTATGKGHVVSNFPVFSQKDKSSEGAKIIGPLQKNQPVLQQLQQPRGPGFIFSFTQYQAPQSQPGASKSVTSVDKPSSSGNAIAGIPTNASALPTVATAMSFSYPKLSANESPYLTILPNNGYPFPIFASVGNQPVLRGGNPVQALPFYNGSFCSSQMLQPQQSHSQVQPVHQKESSSSGSPSSHKQAQAQQLLGAPIGGNNFLITPSVQSQQQQKQQPRKLETEVAGGRASQSLKSSYGQSFIVPLQPNFTLVPSTMVGNHGEKDQQQPHEKSLNGPQAFALSFASNGSNVPSNLSFSTIVQNSAVLQSLPNITRQGHASTQKKNHQLSEGKSGDGATNPDDGKKLKQGKSPSMGQTLIFENSARNLNFVPSPFSGNWPSGSGSINSTKDAAIVANSSNSQQHQLLQLQKQHILNHSDGAAQSKAMTSSNLASSSIGSRFIGPVLSQSNSYLQNLQWTNSTKAPTTEALLVSNTSITQQHGRSPQCQISFGGNSKSHSAPQAPKMPQSNQASSLLVTASPSSNSNLRTTSTNTKATNTAVPVSQSRQIDNSSTASSQKTSPVCGRNVPSILSTCPSHLSELKY